MSVSASTIPSGGVQPFNKPPICAPKAPGASGSSQNRTPVGSSATVTPIPVFTTVESVRSEINQVQKQLDQLNPYTECANAHFVQNQLTRLRSLREAAGTINGFSADDKQKLATIIKTLEAHEKTLTVRPIEPGDGEEEVVEESTSATTAVPGDVESGTEVVNGETFYDAEVEDSDAVQKSDSEALTAEAARKADQLTRAQVLGNPKSSPSVSECVQEATAIFSKGISSPEDRKKVIGFIEHIERQIEVPTNPEPYYRQIRYLERSLARLQGNTAVRTSNIVEPPPFLEDMKNSETVEQLIAVFNDSVSFIKSLPSGSTVSTDYYKNTIVMLLEKIDSFANLPQSHLGSSSIRTLSDPSDAKHTADRFKSVLSKLLPMFPEALRDSLRSYILRTFSSPVIPASMAPNAETIFNQTIDYFMTFYSVESGHPELSVVRTSSVSSLSSRNFSTRADGGDEEADQFITDVSCSDAYAYSIDARPSHYIITRAASDPAWYFTLDNMLFVIQSNLPDWEPPTFEDLDEAYCQIRDGLAKLRIGIGQEICSSDPNQSFVTGCANGDYAVNTKALYKLRQGGYASPTTEEKLIVGQLTNLDDVDLSNPSVVKGVANPNNLPEVQTTMSTTTTGTKRSNTVSVGYAGDPTRVASVTLETPSEGTLAFQTSVNAADVTGLAPVAKTGNAADVTGLATVAKTGDAADVTGLAPVAKTGNAADVTGLAPVARSGHVRDLEGAGPGATAPTIVTNVNVTSVEEGNLISITYLGQTETPSTNSTSVTRDFQDYEPVQVHTLFTEEEEAEFVALQEKFSAYLSSGNTENFQEAAQPFFDFLMANRHKVFADPSSRNAQIFQSFLQSQPDFENPRFTQRSTVSSFLLQVGSEVTGFVDSINKSALISSLTTIGGLGALGAFAIWFYKWLKEEDRKIAEMKQMHDLNKLAYSVVSVLSHLYDERERPIPLRNIITRLTEVPLNLQCTGNGTYHDPHLFKSQGGLFELGLYYQDEDGNIRIFIRDCRTKEKTTVLADTLIDPVRIAAKFFSVKSTYEECVDHMSKLEAFESGNVIGAQNAPMKKSTIAANHSTVCGFVSKFILPLFLTQTVVHA